MTNLTKQQGRQLKALWDRGDRLAWLELLRRLAPEEAKKLPDYIVDAIANSANPPAATEPAYPEGCSPEELALYANATRDATIFELTYIDGFTDERRVEKATAGMLHDLIAAVEADAALPSLLANYWNALAEPVSSENEQKISDLWRELSAAFDPILVGLFGEVEGRGQAAMRLKTIAVSYFKQKILNT